MRGLAAALLTIGVLGVGSVGASAHLLGRGDRKPPVVAPRVLYTSDWSGTSEIYAVDPSGKAPPGQLTFGRASACVQSECGYFSPAVSPDGSRLLVQDAGGCSGHEPSLYAARADGSRLRRLARSKYSCPVPIPEARWAPDSKRVAYYLDGEVSVVRADGSHRVQLGQGWDPAWSSRGLVAFLTSVEQGPGYYSSLVVARPGRSSWGIDRATEFAWSPDGKWLAYIKRVSDRSLGEQLLVAPATGSRRRVLTAGTFLYPSWSSDGRFISVWTTDGYRIVDVATGKARTLPEAEDVLAWSPTGHVYAADREGGVYAVDAHRGAARLLTRDSAGTAAWSPDGRQLAYTTSSQAPDYDYAASDLRVATVGAGVRTLVTAAGDRGGSIGGLVWTRPPAGARYRQPAKRTIASVTADQLVAPWSITKLAADGARVAYVSCGHVFAWTPSSGVVVQAEPAASLSPNCSLGDYTPFEIYSLAVSGDRIAFADREGNMGQQWWVHSETIGALDSFATIDAQTGSSGCSSGRGLGDLVGSAGLLFFSAWHDQSGCPARTTDQQIRRIDPGTCIWSREGPGPCPIIATSPSGPLAPFDADAARVVAGGDNATEILSSDGTLLKAIPVSALAAQLAGSDLVVLVRGELLDYDASSGVLRHTIPLPDVPSGGECGGPHSGAWECHSDARLILEDAAHGLVTYILDGQVHLLRLGDGADTVVATGTLARFMDAGLVYTDGAHLHLVPFDRLPIQ